MSQPVQQPGPRDGQLLLSLHVDEPGRLDLLLLHHHLLIVGPQDGRLQHVLEHQLLPWHSRAAPMGSQLYTCLGQVPLLCTILFVVSVLSVVSHLGMISQNILPTIKVSSR